MCGPTPLDMRLGMGLHDPFIVLLAEPEPTLACAWGVVELRAPMRSHEGLVYLCIYNERRLPFVVQVVGRLLSGSRCRQCGQLSSGRCRAVRVGLFATTTYRLAH